MPEHNTSHTRPGHPGEGMRGKLYQVIFEADTTWGKIFDLGLILTILLSVVAVMLDSVAEISDVWGRQLLIAEWVFTALFSIEYLLRLYSFAPPLRYARSFFGVVDLMAVLPTYLSVLLPGAQFLLVIRVLRVMRIFRVLKFAQYVGEAGLLMQALKASRRKITVFLFAVLTTVIILGSLMYLVEGPGRGFSSIPRSVYWAIVTLTTVGYGDISPQTPWGQALASVIMILGYGIIAVPTDIVTVELSHVARLQGMARRCHQCGENISDADALYCRRCGAKL